MNRKNGRITFDSSSSLPDVKLVKMRDNHILHVLDFLTDGNLADAQLGYIDMNNEQLIMVKEVIKANFWRGSDFDPVAGQLFTWEYQRDESMSEMNHFQVALIYNEHSTYALHNYATVNFTGTVNVRPTVGFSLANSYESAFLPFNGGNSAKLASASGVGNRTLGYFIYRIDTWPPIRGGCLSEDPPTPADRSLASTVTRDSVLGGGLAIISARCPEPNARGTCTMMMDGRLIGQSATLDCPLCRGIFHACRVPPSYREGRATFTLKMNLQSDITYSADFSFVSPDEPTSGAIKLENLDNWFKLAADRKISYDPKLLPGGDLKLRIVGYSESGVTQIKADSVLTKDLIEVAADPSGSMDLNSVSCPETKAECDTHHVGYLEIFSPNATVMSLRSRVIPLGWFVNKFYTDKQQPSWFRDRCKAVSLTEEKVRNQLMKLVCPGTLAQARADTSRYLRISYCPDLPGGCNTATPAQQCFVSRPENNVDTLGTPASVCCYDDTKGHMLFQESPSSSDALTLHGSRSLRSHPDGLPQSANLLPGQVSFMSHWYWDTLPFLYCCRWSNQGDCPYVYLHERPTPGQSAYAVGRGSSSVGDPHLTSFSGRPYLFNGLGEYWLLRSSDFQVQGRYQLIDPNIKTATFLVALAVKVDNGPSFTLSLLPGAGRFLLQRKSSDSVVTEVRLRMDQLFLEGGVTIKLNKADNVVIQLSLNSRSVGIDLYADKSFSFMNSFVSLSDKMKNQTRGLLGRWTDNSTSEFVDVNEKMVEFRSNMSEFNTAFCDGNHLTDRSESLFTYNGGEDFTAINRIQRNQFKGVFSREQVPEHGSETSVCQSDADCIFDLRVTQKIEIGQATAEFGKTFGSMQQALNSTVGYCDKPNIRGVLIAPNSNLREGSTLSLNCVAPLKSSRASETITCQKQTDNSLKWTPDTAVSNFVCAFPSVDPTTTGEANVGLIVGITVPLVVLLLVAIVVAVVLTRRRSNPAAGSGGRPRPQQQQQHNMHTSQATIVSSPDSEAGYENSANTNRRYAPRSATAHSGGEGNVSAAPSVEFQSNTSYNPSQMEQLEPDDFNATYTQPRAQISKSEQV